MKKISPFREMIYSRRYKGNDVKDYPSVFDKLNQLTEQEAELIYQYLINGVEVIEFLSPEPDIVDPKFSVLTKVFADDKYVWTMMIPHLVKNYKTALPNEVIEHIKKQKIFANQRNEAEQKKILLNKENSPVPMEVCKFEDYSPPVENVLSK